MVDVKEFIQYGYESLSLPLVRVKLSLYLQRATLGK